MTDTELANKKAAVVKLLWRLLYGALVLFVLAVLMMLQEFGFGFQRSLSFFLFFAYWSAVLFAMFLWSPDRIKAMLFLVLVVGMLTLRLVPFTLTTTFLADLAKVEPGMTVEEVDAIMAGYMRGGGKNGTLCFRFSELPAHNASIGCVYFAHGLVTHTDYFPD